MKKNLKALLLSFSFFILTALLLIFPKESLFFSLTGLQLWFNKMIPALLPFMILTGVMIRLNLTECFSRLLQPVLAPILRISPSGIYAVIVGFLCGFPMGAKVIADLYLLHKISKKEATFLLSFCNNIGPVYFISFVLPLLGLEKKTPYIFGMYGLPFLYGILLRFTVYRNIPEDSYTNSKEKKLISSSSDAQPSLLDALDNSIVSSLHSIAKLGGYMVLFNLLNIIPFVLKINNRAILHCLLEITGGISRLGNSAPLPVLMLLPFGGLSCIAQTFSMIKETDLSLGNYIFHKITLTVITICYYCLWQLFSPSSFLL